MGDEGISSSSSKQRVRVNEDITARSVRVIDGDGEQAGVMGSSEALAMAQEAGLDLVEISPNAQPPVVKIMDYGKYLFQRKKTKQKSVKAPKQKEIKLRHVTGEGDYQVKLRNLITFLGKGYKVKVTIRFRGREVSHHKLGLALLERMVKDLTEHATMEQLPKMEGRQLVMLVSPLKK